MKRQDEADKMNKIMMDLLVGLKKQMEATNQEPKGGDSL
jgi:hypothetical protein